MSDTRWLRVSGCRDCPDLDCEFMGGANVVTGGFHPNCPLPRLGDIPEVRALIRAAKEYIICQTTIFEDALDEALDPFADKGEEK